MFGFENLNDKALEEVWAQVQANKGWGVNPLWAMIVYEIDIRWAEGDEDRVVQTEAAWMRQMDCWRKASVRGDF